MSFIQSTLILSLYTFYFICQFSYTCDCLIPSGFYKQLPEPVSSEACRRLQYRRKSDSVKRRVREKFLNIWWVTLIQMNVLILCLSIKLTVNFPSLLLHTIYVIRTYKHIHTYIEVCENENPMIWLEAKREMKIIRSIFNRKVLME